MTTKVQAEFLAAGIISDQTQVSAAGADHILIFDASDNSLKKSLVSTITSSSAADDITAGDAAVTISTTSGDITIDNGSSDNDIIFKGTDGGSDITALTLDMSAGGLASFNNDVNASGSVVAQTKLAVGVSAVHASYGLYNQNNAYFNGAVTIDDTLAITAGALSITSDGSNTTTLTESGSGDFTIDVAGDLTLDAAGNDVKFLDDGTQIGQIEMASSSFNFRSIRSDDDILFKGNDGGSTITALTLDMSAAGAANFNSTVTATQFIGDVVNGQTTENTVANDDVIAFYDTSAGAIRKTAISNLPSSGGGGSSAADDITTGDAAVTIATSTGNITLDSPADIILDAGGDDWKFYEDGNAVFEIKHESHGVDFLLNTTDEDWRFKGSDGGSTITALHLDISEAGAATFNGKITADAGIDIDNFNIDGTTIALSSGDITVDSAGRIDLSADDNGEVRLFDGSSMYAQFKDDSDRLRIESLISDADMIFVGNDGGSEVTALTLDMSDNGAATFNSTVTHKGSTASSSSNFISSWINTGQSYYGYLYADSGGTGIFSHTSASIQEGIYFQNSTDKTFFYNQGAARGVIDGAGNVIFVGNITAYGSTSDIRLKENIEIISNPLDKVKELKGVTFNYKKDGKKSTGLIAQDLEKVLPEAVYESSDINDDDDKHLAIRYGNTVGLLVEAIKELEARVKELENK